MEPGAQADPASDAITVDGRPLAAREPLAYVLLHKPRGYVTSLRDPEGRPLVVDLLPGGLPRVFPVGRLDYETEGLLILTNDGDLANRLLHPRYEIPRVYEAEVEGRVAAADLPRWRRGVMLADGPAVPCDVRVLRPGERTTWLTVVLTEGRNREVRRYCQAMGHRVVRLKRVRFGPIRLGRLRAGRVPPADRGGSGALEALARGGPGSYNAPVAEVR